MRSRISAGLAILLVFGGLYFLLRRSPRPGGLVDKADECSVASLDWMEATESYDEKAVASLAASLEAAAKADASKLQNLAEAGGKGSLGTNFSTPSEYSSVRKARVSQEFFQAAFAWRQSVCNLERQLSRGILTDPAALKKAQEQLVELSSQFGKVKSHEESRSVAPDKVSLSFGTDGTPQDLALRSTLTQPSDWALEKSDKFEIFPTSGTIRPGGSAAIRVTPNAAALASGRNAEEVWFNWTGTSENDGRFSVTITAVKFPALEYNVAHVDDQLILRLNGVEFERTSSTNGWRRAPASAALRAGDNNLEIQVYNAATRQGNILGPREGWNYSMQLRADNQELPLTGGNDTPPVEEWGATFTVKRVAILVDGNTGRATLSPR